MKTVGLVGLALAVPGGLFAVGLASAADMTAVGTTPAAKDPTCKVLVDPYKNYACLDKYLGDEPMVRFLNYYKLEWGHDSGPSDPNAPNTFRPDWSQAFPQSSPPMPFTEWPYGGSEIIGENRPASVDSPLMPAIQHTSLGQMMADGHLQMYGWVDGGANLSTSSVHPGGNAPAAYSFDPNSAQLDQAVIYFERTPDETQLDHVDWGFRLSAIYGENYRYTTAYGVSSYQLLGHNLYNGYDFPMLYGELYVPVLAGLNIRLGRYVSVPDIEAQLAPNNYMYSHSMTYVYDNYTNSGIALTQAVNRNWILQLGLTVGTEAGPWHWNQTATNPAPFITSAAYTGPNLLYPGNTFPIDPGAVPTFTGGIRYQTDSGYDNVYVVANGYNAGLWGYNNLQWLGVTWFHKFNEQWHISFESYWGHVNAVPNSNNATTAAIIAAGGTPFSPVGPGGPGIGAFNSVSTANCTNTAALTCNANWFTALAYLNYRIDGLNNLSWRAEFFNDEEGFRTGVKTSYIELGFGWQHWLSPQIEFRPEVSYYNSINAAAFNGNGNANTAGFGGPSGACAQPGAPPNPGTNCKNYEIIAESDVIIHF